MRNLDLENIENPLQERYDRFLEWVSQQGNYNAEFLAPKINVEPSVIDLFFELGALEVDEFKIIDAHKIDVGILYLIVHFNKAIRSRIYPVISDFLSLPHPLSAIREFVDQEIVSEYNLLLSKVSGNYWKSISAYLKAKDVNSGLFNAKARSFFYDIGNAVNRNSILTLNQLDYAAQILVFDSELRHGVFFNDQAKKDYPTDCDNMAEALELIKGLIEAGR